MGNVITAPEPFDFKQPVEPPVVFLAGSIDQGTAPRWDLEVIKALADVPCEILNPRREDWDSSWQQVITDDKFRQQVEWELKGLDQCSLIAMSLSKDSKAPISLLELGLYAASGKLVVYCPNGFYRKGNVDIVCKKYGVKVFESFGEFCAAVRRVMMAGASQKVAMQDWDGTDTPDWQRNPDYAVERIGIKIASQVREGDICTVTASFGTMTTSFPLQQLKILRDIIRQGGGKVYVESVHGNTAYVTAYDNPVSRMVGGVDVPVSILKVINFSAAEKVHPYSGHLRRRPDYGEVEPDIEERMKKVANRVASQFLDILNIGKG